MNPLQKAAQDAIDVQDACNIRGVCNSLNTILRNVLPIGSQTHPIVYLFLYKLMALNGHEQIGDWEVYDWAITQCQRISADASFTVQPYGWNQVAA